MGKEEKIKSLKYWLLFSNKTPDQQLTCTFKKTPNRSIIRIYLGERYPHIYLTGQEAACLKNLLKGNTVPEVAKKLKLSSRTVEYYVKNIRIKLKCRTKSELIEKILNTDFVKIALDEKLLLDKDA